MFSLLSLIHLLALLTFTTAQDACNLLPVSIPNLPLHSLIPNTLTPTNTTLCDRYAPANSTQLAFITKLVNLAFTGGFTPLPNPWPANPNGTYQSTGILDPAGVYRDPCFTVTKINLVPWFNGTYASTNRNGKAVARNFLDGGSTVALRENVPAWDTTSNQYKMMTHFYQYFGVILGCSSSDFPKYTGDPSQAQVHRFMDLPGPAMHYFIHNVYDAALTLGVAGPDLVTHVGDAISIGIALDNLFLKKCSPAQKIAPYQSSELQSMCGDEKTCARWTFPNATCSAYNQTGFGVMPALASPASASAGVNLCNPHYPGGTWRP